MIKDTLDLNVQILTNLVANFAEVFISYSAQIIGATLILIVGFYFAGKFGTLTRKNLEKFKKLDPLIIPVVGNVVRYGVIILTIIAVLGQFGVQTTSIIAVLGAAGLAIGLALQGTLSNVAAGVMLLLLRPFNNGDWVETGEISGTIKEVGCTANTGSRSLSTRITSTRACTTDLLETTISLVSSSVMGEPANTSPKSTLVSETSI